MHQGNSLFVNSRSLSPATSNLVAMRMVRTDRWVAGDMTQHDTHDTLPRWAYSAARADPLLPAASLCRHQPDLYEQQHSSLPMPHYSQAHCRRVPSLELLQEFTKINIERRRPHFIAPSSY